MSSTANPIASDAEQTDLQLAALALEHGTPLYVYNLHRLCYRVAELRTALSKAQATLYFATMANDQLPVLKILASLGVGACVNSIPHLELAREAGFAPIRTQFTSTGIASEDMDALRLLGIRSNFDSLSQLEAWLGLGASEAGIRVNAASLGQNINGDRIGIEATEVAEAFAMTSRLGCRLTGLHIYVGTNFQHPDEMLPTLAAFFDLAASVRSLSYVNIGGGVGIDYRHNGPGFDVLAFGDSVSEYAKRLRASLRRHVDVIFEPGRALTAECGTFVTSVTDVKRLGAQRFAAVDGSIAVFPRPFHHPDSPHRVRQVTAGIESSRNTVQCTKTFIVGRTTFSRDILGTASLPDDLRIGDLLAFDDAGAYSQSMTSRFLGQPEPRAVFLDG